MQVEKDRALFSPQAGPVAKGASMLVASGGPLSGAPQRLPPGGEQDRGGTCTGPFASCPGTCPSAGGVKYHEKQHAKGGSEERVLDL